MAYIFDFIVNKLEFYTDQEINCNELVIEVKFGETILKLESSKSNKNAFTEGRSYEFNSTIAELAEMTQKPISLQIMQLENIIGQVEIYWDDKLAHALTKEYFSAHSQFEDADIEENGMKKGEISVAISLHCKCTEDIFKNYGELADAKGNLNICYEMDQVLDPTDVLFVIGDSAGNSRNVLAQCDDSECPARLDVSRYQIVRGKLVRNTEILNPCGNLECCELGNVQVDYDKKLKKKISEEDCASSEFSYTPENSSTFQGSGDFKGTWASEELNRSCPKTKTSENMKFVPKLSPTPYYGHSKNQFSTVAENKNDDIGNDTALNLILEKWNSDCCTQKNNSKTSPDNDKCVCSCVEDKICPHCRINKVVNKLLQDIKGNKCNPLLLTNSITNTNSKTESEEQCDVLQDYGSDDSITGDVIPYLSKTLQALKAKYKLNNEVERSRVEENKGKNKRKLKNINKINGMVCDRMTVCYPQQIMVKDCNFKSKQQPNIQRVKYRSKRNSKYPGVVCGHKTCKGYGSGVPKNMGWLWNKHKCSLRKGWKPGAIGKPIKEIMKYFLTDFPADSLLVSKCAKQEKMINENASSEILIQKPTLKVIKKNGEYLITMRPLKQIKDIQYSYDSYLNVKPIQFRIIKSPILVHKKEIKNNLKECGFNKCTCHLPLIHCFCRSFVEKENIDKEVDRICESKDIPNNIKNTLVFSDSTDSESDLDIEFTPPVGLFKPHLRNQSDIACKETQYNTKDFKTEPISVGVIVGRGSGDGQKVCPGWRICTKGKSGPGGKGDCGKGKESRCAGKGKVGSKVGTCSQGCAARRERLAMIPPPPICPPERKEKSYC